MSAPELPGQRRRGSFSLAPPPEAPDLPEIVSRRERLADDAGRWNAAAGGWSRAPVHIGALPAGGLHRKRWNLWRVQSGERLFGIGLANLGFAGAAFAFLYDRSAGEFHASQRWFPWPVRRIDLGPRFEDPVRLRRRDDGLSFLFEKGVLRIRADLPWRGGGRLRADLDLSAPESLESLGVAASWNARRYAWRLQSPLWRVRGEILAGRERLTPGQSPGQEAFAWGETGRGVWPYRQRLVQTAGMGRLGKQSLALHFSAGWPGESAEQCLWIDGVAHPLAEAIEWQYDPANYRLPWLLRTAKSDDADLTFVPDFEHAARRTRLWSGGELRQLFGRFHGRLRIAGRKREIEGLSGWATALDHRG